VGVWANEEAENRYRRGVGYEGKEKGGRIGEEVGVRRRGRRGGGDKKRDEEGAVKEGGKRGGGGKGKMEG